MTYGTLPRLVRARNLPQQALIVFVDDAEEPSLLQNDSNKEGTTTPKEYGKQRHLSLQ